MATSHTHLGAIDDHCVASVCGHCAGDLESYGCCRDNPHKGGAGGRGQWQDEAVIQHNGALTVVESDCHRDGRGTI